MDPKSWLGVEFRHLAALKAVEDAGSFRGAAEELGYVQSAVSQQVARLEALVGVRLIERSRGTGPVELTHAGRLLLGHVTQIVARFDAARADLCEVASGRSATLRVGICESVATRLLPSILRDFRERWPGITVTPHESSSDYDHFQAVERGELELAFTTLPLETGPFDALELLVDRFVLLVHADSPLARDRQVPSLAEVAALPLITQPGRRITSLVYSGFLAAGLQPNIVLSSGSNAAVQALVGAGLGCALLPLLSVDAMDTATAVIELGDQLPNPRLALLWNSERQGSPALRAFCDAAWTAADGLARMRERASLIKPIAA
jgi:DNA-binding transcriptional LysR family regulator